MNKRLFQLKSVFQMPGNFGLPFLGEALELLSTEEAFYWKRFHQYGSVFKTRIMGKKVAFLIGPDANRLVLLDQADYVSSEKGWFFLKPLFGQGVLLQDGVQHQATRRLLQPAFHHQAIANYFDTIQIIVADFLKGWNQQGTIALTDEFRKLTLMVASHLFLGSQTSQEVEQISQWFTDLINGRKAVLPFDVSWTVYGRSQQARRQLQAFLRTVIHERQRQGKLYDYQDVLGLMLMAEDEDGHQLSESQVIDQALLLLFAGHETTATALSWLLYELGVHPQWQERLRDELNQVAGNEPIVLHHLKQLTQMSYVLKEIERLYPPVALYGFQGSGVSVAGRGYNTYSD